MIHIINCIRPKKIYGYIVTAEWLAKFAVSRGSEYSSDHVDQLAEEGLMRIEEETGIELYWHYTRTNFVDDIVATLYTDDDFNVETMSFPKIPQAKLDKLMRLL